MNIIFASLLLLGLVTLKIKNENISVARKNFIIFLLIVAIILLVLVFLSVKYFKYDNNAYLFGFEIKKVYTGLFFILSELLVLYLIVYIWGLIFLFDKLHELRTLYRTVFFVLIIITFSIFYVWNLKEYREKKFITERYDYALIPGAAVWKKEKPSPIFEARIRKAFELYQEKKISKIILTGSNAPGELSEAETAFKYLVRLGVKVDDMIIENKTSTTTEQVRYLKSISNQLDNKKILIISDSFHLPRLMEMCKFFDLEASAIASNYRLSFSKTVYYRLRESIALLLFWLFAI
ncbi:YdcF family protein [Rosettibacter firmus]|uniref:YdcF family protein n=1 Tax=Rosettibacter firmus TaxID=3111522 RepID=UPI00336C0231